MNLTNDQYIGLHKLDRWYRKYQHQIIEVSGVIGTGVWQLIQNFIELESFDPREIMYLSYDQKQVIELASKRYHAYYINRIIYNYVRITDFHTLSVINPNSKVTEYEWKKKLKKKIDKKYKLMIVFDSTLLNFRTLNDLSSFGIPIILLRDPMLLPSPDTYTFLRDANIELREPHPELVRNPIVHFAHKVLLQDKISPGSYDTVMVVPRKQMNLYNLKSSDMNITLSEKSRDEINMIYRKKILKRPDMINVPNERMIVMDHMYNHKLVNTDEKRIKLFLTKGTVGYLNKINKHALYTKYVPIEFRLDFYHDVFTDLILDRHYLNKIEVPSRQMIPDETIHLEYAYALTPTLARVNHWNKITLLIDQTDIEDLDFYIRSIYTAISRARSTLTIII